MSINTIKIHDQEFQILSANLTEEVSDNSEVKWNAMITTSEKNAVWGNSAPNVRCEDLSSRWGNIESLQGKTITIPTAYDEETDEYLFTLYVFGHEDIYDSEIKFGTIVNNQISVIWKGKCNVFYDEQYSENLSLEINMELQLDLKSL